ncbi:extracellular solute-binding protein [Paenibacillus ginsengarvi]|uniref:Extracellular solute-binding protein n=1 Tax=Paenibacillus ginsengarvi TaxID=400777 RepID=A0A3B0CRF3_9BACL|nr:extracellular solute-binding protein [Paenibacillus ginsengarvi]
MACKQNVGFALTALSLAFALQGCSGGNDAPEGGGASSKEGVKTVDIGNEPIELKIWVNMSDDLFQKLVVQPVKLKYPNISLTMVGVDKKIPDLIASGEVPDIITDTIGSIPKYKDLAIIEELTPYVKKFGMDLGRINPVVLETVQRTSGNSQLLGLPISGNVVMMYYNKDIFDKFGVPYPKDGLTWDDAYELAKKVTKTDGGVKYRGFDFQDSFQFTANQLSLPVVDDKTNKALVNNDGWKKMFQNYARFLAIPGNEVDDKTYGKGMDQFLKDKTLALYVTSSMFSRLPDAINGGLNFDMVTLPSFSEVPNTTTQVDGGVRMVSTTSKKKDAAFAALSAMLSDEAQKQIAMNGNTAVLKDSKINEEFGKNIEILQTRNRLGFVKNQPAKPTVSITKFDNDAHSIMRSQFKKMVVTQIDVNSALREAEELINKKIAETAGK